MPIRLQSILVRLERFLSVWNPVHQFRIFLLVLFGRCSKLFLWPIRLAFRPALEFG